MDFLRILKYFHPYSLRLKYFATKISILLRFEGLFPYLFSEFLFEFYCSDFPHAFWLKVHAFWFILSSFNVFTRRKYSKAPLLGQQRSGHKANKNVTLLETQQLDKKIQMSDSEKL